MFFTPVHIPPVKDKIKLGSHILSAGSCFAQVIGNRLRENKFETFINPFGTIYNPASLFRLIHLSVNKAMPPEDTYVVNNGIHFNYKFHSDFSASNRKDLEAQIAQAITSTHEFLKSAEWVILTLGTAYCYETTNDHTRIVSNCHKMPAKNFRKRILQVEEISHRFEQMLMEIHTLNPQLKFIFTVSPVRHIRDTLIQNSISKAALRVAVELIKENHPEKVHYFPSYEIMTDELRDYRFYKADMIHPSEVAEDHIWKKFVDIYFHKEAIEFLSEWEHIRKALHHKAFRPESMAHQEFIRKTIGNLQQLSKKVDVSQEIKSLEQQLS